MSRLRTVCYGSDVYHLPGCRYEGRMKPENTLYVGKKNAIAHGCRICKCCGSVKHFLDAEKEVVDRYRENGSMAIKLLGDKVFVKTELSCWMIVYEKDTEVLTLYHRNESRRPIDFERPDKESYHRQKDVPFSTTLENYLSYIHDHDNYKNAVMHGRRFTDFKNPKGSARSERYARKEKGIRVNYLFRLLEEGYSTKNVMAL